jgi:hypothetical protein
MQQLPFDRRRQKNDEQNRDLTAPEVPEAGGVHPSHWQGSQKRSLPVSSATMNVWPGVPTVTSA